MSVSPPGPLFQKINASIHREPLSSLLNGLYWSNLFLICTPLALVALAFQMVWRLLTWFTGKSSVCPTFDPKAKPEYDMAVVITGCDSGFGKELAIFAADAGYSVFAGCYRHESSKKLFSTIPKIKSFQLDVTSEKDTSAAAEIVERWLTETSIPIEDVGRKRVLHALINNAGIGIFSETDWSELSTFQAMMDVNLFGLIRVVKAFLPLFKQQAISKSFNGMRIINVVSIAGFTPGAPGLTGYCASKAAAQSYTETLRMELLPFNISVTSVNPSFHSTALIPSLEIKSFEQLPPTIQTEYGKSYYDCVASNVNVLFNLCQWNAVIVVEQVMDLCVRSHQSPRQLLVGADAKYFLIGVFKLIPPYVREPILANLVFPRATPVGMMKSNK